MSMITDLTSAESIVAIIMVVIFTFILVAAIYVYFALAWQTIAKRRNYKYPWFSWIPILNIVQIYELGGLHWAWIFLSLLPMGAFPLMFTDPTLYNYVAIALALPAAIVSTVALWKILKTENYPAGWSLLQILMMIPIVNFLAIVGYAILVGVVAWGKNNGKVMKPKEASTPVVSKEAPKPRLTKKVTPKKVAPKKVTNKVTKKTTKKTIKAKKK